jgi:hypothetical protein
MIMQQPSTHFSSRPSSVRKRVPSVAKLAARVDLPRPDSPRNATPCPPMSTALPCSTSFALAAQRQRQDLVQVQVLDRGEVTPGPGQPCTLRPSADTSKSARSGKRSR